MPENPESNVLRSIGNALVDATKPRYAVYLVFDSDERQASSALGIELGEVLKRHFKEYQILSLMVNDLRPYFHIVRHDNSDKTESDASSQLGKCVMADRFHITVEDKDTHALNYIPISEEQFKLLEKLNLPSFVDKT